MDLPKGWSKQISKKTGKDFYFCQDGRTQWVPPNNERELKKQQHLKKSDVTCILYGIKHVLINFFTIDFKDMENYIYDVLDLGSCHENKHSFIWEKEGCRNYTCMDIKESDYKGDIFSPNPWNLIKSPIDIFCVFDVYPLDEEDIKIMFTELDKKSKIKSRLLCILKKNECNQFLKFTSNWKISFQDNIAKVISFIGLDNEKFNASRLFEWDLIYKPIFDLYKIESLNAMEWFALSQYEIIIFEKQPSAFIKSLYYHLQSF
jgi:hypothetical protein